MQPVEEKSNISASPGPLIAVRFVSPGGQSPPPNRAECGDQVWERKPRETVQDFERRVCESLQRHEDGPTVLIFFPEKRTEDRRISEITARGELHG
jgi:hypothetical protein